MKIAVLFAEGAQIRQLQEQNAMVEILIISEIPTNWIKNSDAYQNLSLHKAIHMYQEGEISKFLIFPALKKNLSFFYEDVLKPDINEDDILYVSLEQMINSELYIKGFTRFRERTDLDFISVHVMDRCNLKCAYCSSMSGLVTNGMKISFSKTKSAIYQLGCMYKSVNYIQILGGEPLLNDMLLDYCGILRDCFPYSYIEIVTNGTLILRQKQEFFDVLKALDIAVLVSYYPVTATSIDEINLLLCKNDITYTISEKITHFEKYYDFSGISDIDKTFRNCQAAQYCKNGLTLFEDYIYPCVAPIALNRAEIIANPSIYGIHISEHTTRQDINSLIQPLQICKYCHMDQFQKWRQLESNEIDCWESWSI